MLCQVWPTLGTVAVRRWYLLVVVWTKYLLGSIVNSSPPACGGEGVEEGYGGCVYCENEDVVVGINNHFPTAADVAKSKNQTWQNQGTRTQQGQL